MHDELQLKSEVKKVITKCLRGDFIQQGKLDLEGAADWFVKQINESGKQYSTISKDNKGA